MTQTLPTTSQTIADLHFALAHVLSDQLRGLCPDERKATRRVLHLVAQDCAERVAACDTDAERIDVLRSFIRGERS